MAAVHLQFPVGPLIALKNTLLLGHGRDEWAFGAVTNDEVTWTDDWQQELIEGKLHMKFLLFSCVLILFQFSNWMPRILYILR